MNIKAIEHNATMVVDISMAALALAVISFAAWASGYKYSSGSLHCNDMPDNIDCLSICDLYTSDAMVECARCSQCCRVLYLANVHPTNDMLEYYARVGGRMIRAPKGRNGS